MNFQRKCPKCQSEIVYKSKSARNLAEKKSGLCRKCADRQHSERMNGENNPFFGKTASDYARKIQRERPRKPLSNEKRTLLSEKLKQLNPKQNKSNYQIWIEKYGQEEADKRQAIYSQKQRINATGERNPMYGKVSSRPGNGWKGYYKGNRFLSLKELMFMLSMDDNRQEYEVCTLKIGYIGTKGQNRTYTPDFIVDNKIIEIKPKHRQEDRRVQLKFDALKTWCLTNNFECEFVDIDVDFNRIKLAYDAKDFYFDEKYEVKFVNFCKRKRL